MWIVFVVLQFFSERKYPIGILNPPTITYCLSFTVLFISFILYLNYDYYFSFLEQHTRFNFIRILLINLALVITGIVFMFFKRVNKKWIQALFLSLLAINMVYSYTSVINSDYRAYLAENEIRDGYFLPRTFPKGFTPRKIRIVLMDGLSLPIIQSFTSQQKLLNFNELIKNGVSGRVKTYKPNLDLSMLNSALTGLRPAQFTLHSYDKFKVARLGQEFDIRPRFIFFRKSPYVNSITFYKRFTNNVLDNLGHHYENNRRRAVRLIKPLFVDPYSEWSLQKNNRFVPLFSEVLKKESLGDENYRILKKFFFQDDFIKNMIPDLKDSDVYYTVVRMPGLGVVSKYFYQWHMPEIFGNIRHDDVNVKKYGWVMEKYYEYYDSIIGNLMSTTGDDELLVILSFYEYEPLPVWRRVLVNLFGSKDIYVYKNLSSRGTILLYEKNALRKGYPLQDMAIRDIFPTLLYYSGFPLSRDLQGEVMRDIFKQEFLINNPFDLHPGDRKR